MIPPAPQPGPPQPLPAPPQLTPGAVRQPPETATQEMPTLPPPVEAPKPAKPARTRRPTGNAALPQEQPSTTPSPETPAATVPAPAPALTLQPILGNQEIAERNRRIKQYLDKAMLIVSRAEKLSPDGAQRELIEQVKTFAQQAEEARKVDLVRAENLAERAEVLSRALIK
ncbi:hypothetical protein [Bryobacter aggregatus]|uniref:hypothetical protein n=1 Tax=Bryobacter aggregatus TaxID=360054 RepID=UPI0012BA84A3|nr:hypothetical protein [Bryobacter aggregatus]